MHFGVINQVNRPSAITAIDIHRPSVGSAAATRDLGFPAARPSDSTPWHCADSTQAMRFTPWLPATCCESPLESEKSSSLYIHNIYIYIHYIYIILIYNIIYILYRYIYIYIFRPYLQEANKRQRNGNKQHVLWKALRRPLPARQRWKEAEGAHGWAKAGDQRGLLYHEESTTYKWTLANQIGWWL